MYETELLELLKKVTTDTIRCCSSDMLFTPVDTVDAAKWLPPTITYAL
jgi:hypothetical protein